MGADALPSLATRAGAGAGAVLRSIVAGALVALFVLVGGLAFLTAKQPSWTARGEALVLPRDRSSDPFAEAGLYESLSSGEVVSTFAELLRLQRFEISGADSLGLSDEEREATSTEVTVVPNTLVIALTVTAPTSEIADSMVEVMVEEWGRYLQEVSTPFEARILSSGVGTATKSGPSNLQLLVVLAAAALVAGLAAQQAVYHLMLAFRRTSGPPEEAALPEDGAREGNDSRRTALQRFYGS